MNSAQGRSDANDYLEKRERSGERGMPLEFQPGGQQAFQLWTRRGGWTADMEEKREAHLASLGE